MNKNNYRKLYNMTWLNKYQLLRNGDLNKMNISLT